jgi:two-component system response regulator PilR (NtrC family)
MSRILVVDDEQSMCEMLEILLRRESHHVETVGDLAGAYRKLESALFDIIISDVRLASGESGLDVLRFCRKLDSEAAFILITAHATMETAIEAIKIGGAVDYLIKGSDLTEQLKYTVARALEGQRVKRENVTLKRELQSRNAIENIVGGSGGIEQLKEVIRTIAPTSSTVLVRGESGTGKELVARAIHSCSARADQPFVSINCGAFPETLLESELFGYVKGAFTGANSNRRGLFEAAEKGTLFLDEIGEMSLQMQVSLLRVLQEREVRPLGSSQQVAVDVRLVAATNSDLEHAVQTGRFREDLYYRISVIPLEIPPLRRRREDIPLLAMYFLRRFAREMHKPVKYFTDESLRRLEAYDWPGNVRQLENVVERAVALARAEAVEVGPLSERPMTMTAAAAAGGAARVAISTRDNEAPVSVAQAGEAKPAAPADGDILPKLPPNGLDELMQGIERRYLQTALQESAGVRTKAAELLGVTYRSFRHYCKKYGI